MRLLGLESCFLEGCCICYHCCVADPAQTLWVHNDHLFLLLSLQIGQAVLGVAKFCHVPVISCQSIEHVRASMKLHVVSHPLAGQPRLVCTQLSKREPKGTTSLMPGLAPGTSLHCFLLAKASHRAIQGWENKYRELWKIGAIFIAVSVLLQMWAVSQEVMEKMDDFFFE